MSDGEGPWGRVEAEAARRAPAARPARGRVWLWLAVIAAGGALVFALSRAFPGAVSGGEDWASVGGGIALLALVSARLLVGRRIVWGQTARHAAIWIALVAVLAVGVTYRNELAQVGERVRAQFSGAYPVATAGRELVVAAQEGGGFVVMGQVNGQPVRFLVDTGASDTVLSPADARRLGIDVDRLTYDQTAETANGMGRGAVVVADSLAVGSIRFDKVEMQVNQAPMTTSLLGMSFLGRLESFQVKDGRLYLKSRQ